MTVVNERNFSKMTENKFLTHTFHKIIYEDFSKRFFTLVFQPMLTDSKLHFVLPQNSTLSLW